MAKIEVQDIRNIAVTGPAKAGKTTLVEAMLNTAGTINRMGRIEDGSTVTDFEAEETDRKISISSALAFCESKGKRINLIDTPGFINFMEDTEKVWGFAKEMGLPVMAFINKLDKEGADFSNALDSIKNNLNAEPLPLHLPMGTSEDFKGIIDLLEMKAYTYNDGKAEEGAIPADLKDQADSLRNTMIERVAEADDALLEKYLEDGDITNDEIVAGIKTGTLAKLFVPVVCGSPNTATGADKLMDMVTAYLPSPAELAEVNPVKGTDPEGAEIERKPDPGEPFSAFVFKTIADPFAGKLSLFRVISGTLSPDSAVFNSSSDAKERMGQIFYMQGKNHENVETLQPGEIAVVAKLKNTGTGDTLCDPASLIKYAPVTFAEPLISYAIAPKSKDDEDKVGTGLQRILEEDPALHFHRDEEAHQMILAGMGQLHLEVTLDKLKRKFGVEVEMQAPQIPYRETVTTSAEARHRHKKQSGGKGQFGECSIKISPQPRGTGYEFENNIVGGAVPRQFIPAIDKGIQESMKAGAFAGYKMVDVKISLFDGSYHAVDSSEMAFKIAGSMALKKAVEAAKPVVLEPMMKVVITVPDEFLGTVIGDLNGRRGKVQGMDQIPGSTNQKVDALVPMAEMLTYANQLQSMTAGRGIYTMEFTHYDELPKQLTQKLIEARDSEEEK